MQSDANVFRHQEIMIWTVIWKGREEEIVSYHRVFSPGRIEVNYEKSLLKRQCAGLETNRVPSAYSAYSELFCKCGWLVQYWPRIDSDSTYKVYYDLL
jgi:hypothetical protein